MSRNRKPKTSNKSRKSKSYWYEIEEFTKSAVNKPTQQYFDATQQEPKKKVVLLTPRGENQKHYIDCILRDNNFITFGIGPAGSGKTMIATQVAIKELIEGKIKKIVITRPNVAVDDRDLGALPGDILGKMTPWMLPILDVFAEYYSQKEIKNMLNEKIIDVVPLAFMRGRTFKDAIIIVDEAQGTTPNSLLSILTRIGDNSRMIVTGDLDQKDHRGLDGLTDFVKKFERNNGMNGISMIRFVKKDIQRHAIISSVLSLYGEEVPEMV